MDMICNTFFVKLKFLWFGFSKLALWYIVKCDSIYFSNPPPPPWGTPTPLKNEPPHLKNNPSPPLKHETPFHEMIPRKSTINNNLKSSWNPWKTCLKKFIFSKFGDLQAYSRKLYYQMNSFTGIFWEHFKLPHAPAMFWLEPTPHQIFRSPPPPEWRGGWAQPPMFTTPVGNPVIWHSTRSYLSCCYFCNDIRILCYPPLL